MTFDARNRVNFAVNAVLGHIITAMGKGPLGGIAEFITRLDIFLIGVTVGTERFMVARVTGLTSRSGIKTMLAHEIGSTMIEGAP